MKIKKTPTFYEKLTSQTHIGLDNEVTYRTFPGIGGAIMAQHGNNEPQEIMIFSHDDDPHKNLTIANFSSKPIKEVKTFISANNCCAEQFHHRIFLISKSD